jgi:hypothetical protein
MIDPKELRIGNFVKTWKGIEEIESISKDSIIWTFHPECSTTRAPEEIKPIPLTEEWLLKFGFKLIIHIHGYSFWSLKNCNIKIYDGKTEYYGYTVSHVKSVHSLQNLYFALTGKELKV